MFGILCTLLPDDQCAEECQEKISTGLWSEQRSYNWIRNQSQINLFWCSEGFIVWLLDQCGLQVSTQWTHPVCLLCISTCCGWAPPTELIISPVTVSFVLPRLAVTVVRGSTWIWEILSSTCPCQISDITNIEHHGGTKQTKPPFLCFCPNPKFYYD